MCYDAKWFAVDQLREAVEYLRSQPQTPHTGLIARTNTNAGRYKLSAEPMLLLDQILGKTPSEVWAAFDLEVDRWRTGLMRQSERMRP